jgi:hypothetical protein
MVLEHAGNSIEFPSISTIKNRIRFSKKQKYFLADKMQKHQLEQTGIVNSNILGLQGRYSEKNKYYP